MAKLSYIANVSLDGFIEDPHGSFDWTEPDEEVFAFITDLVRSVGTHLYDGQITRGAPLDVTDRGGVERRFTSGVVYLRHRNLN